MTTCQYFLVVFDVLSAEEAAFTMPSVTGGVRGSRGSRRCWNNRSSFWSDPWWRGQGCCSVSSSWSGCWRTSLSLCSLVKRDDSRHSSRLIGKVRVEWLFSLSTNKEKMVKKSNRMKLSWREMSHWQLMTSQSKSDMSSSVTVTNDCQLLMKSRVSSWLVNKSREKNTNSKKYWVFFLLRDVSHCDWYSSLWNLCNHV